MTPVNNCHRVPSCSTRGVVRLSLSSGARWPHRAGGWTRLVDSRAQVPWMVRLHAPGPRSAKAGPSAGTRPPSPGCQSRCPWCRRRHLATPPLPSCTQRAHPSSVSTGQQSPPFCFHLERARFRGHPVLCPSPTESMCRHFHPLSLRTAAHQTD